MKAVAQMMRNAVENGIPPERAADLTFEAIQKRKFYILPNPEETKQAVRRRMENILNDQNPTFTVPD